MQSRGPAAVAAAAAAVLAFGSSHGTPATSTVEIVFARNGTVYFMRADGSAQRPARLPNYPVWSRDGRRMAFLGGDRTVRRLYVAGASGRNRRPIAPAPAACMAPDWSPDGRSLAYTIDCEVDFMDTFVVGRDGKGRRYLLPKRWWHLGPRWSPGGSRILVVAYPPPFRRGWGLYLVDPDSRNVRRIPRLTMNPDYNADWRWSRDGAAIFLLSDGRLSVVRRRDGRRTALAQRLRKIHSFALSPDGKRLAIHGTDDGRDWDVFVLDADGGNLRQLTDNRAQDRDPAWSPDGRRIVFESDRDGNSEIYVMNDDGSNQTNISRHPAEDVGPTWRR